MIPELKMALERIIIQEIKNNISHRYIIPIELRTPISTGIVAPPEGAGAP